eukprot:Em0003g1698a
MRTRFMCSVSNKAVLKALFKYKEDELTFAKAIAVAMETEDRGSKSGKGDGGIHLPTMPVTAMREISRAVPAHGACGKSDHKAQDCPYRDATCRYCHKRGHLEAVCLKKRRSTQPVRAIAKYQIRTVKATEAVPQLLQSVFIQGKQFMFEVDTGAGDNFCSEDVWCDLGKPSLSPATGRYEVANGQPLPTLGIFSTVVTLQGEESSGGKTVEFTVTKVPQLNLLGRDAIVRLQVNISALMDLSPRVDKEDLCQAYDAGIARAVWLTPVVPIQKASLPGQPAKLRVCGDYSVSVNQQLEPHRHPMPLPEDLMRKLGGGHGFTKIDLADAYNQIMLAPESQRRLALSTHRGVLKQMRLPFGISSAPDYFQEIMDQLTSDLQGVAVYMDDILVSGTTAAEHIQNLRALLKRFHSVLWQVLAQSRYHYGITYRLTKKDIPWSWGAEELEAFQKLKDLLCTDTILVHFNPTLPIGISCDASEVGLGAVLFHWYSDGSERPIANSSKTLTKTQRGYSQIQKEALAIIFALSKFHQFLYGRTFILITDHKPLIALFGPTKATPALAANRLARWALMLSQYQYCIEYRKTSDHGNADALSRLPVGPDANFDGEESEADVDTVCSIKTISLSSAEEEGTTERSIEAFWKLAISLSTAYCCLLYGSSLLRSYWSKISPILATLIPLFQTMLLRFHRKSSKRAITHLTGAPYHPATNGAAERLVQTFKQALSKSSLLPRAALQEFLIQYRRTPRSEGYSPSELLNGHQIRTKIDVLLPSPAHVSQGKQAREATKSQEQEAPNRVALIYSVGTPCYALYCGPRREKDPRWVPAVVTKVYGSHSVSVRVFPRGGTWRRHIEQLRPRYGAQEDADPGEVQVSSSVLVPPSAEGVDPTVDSVDASELSAAVETSIPTKSTRMYRNPRLPTGSDYSLENPRRSVRQHNPIHRFGEHFASQ